MPVAPEFFACPIIGKSFIYDEPSVQDGNGHGTHTAGTVGAVGNNGAGVAGINWKTNIMPVKVLGAAGVGTETEFAAGLKYAADNGARVVSMSLAAPSSVEPQVMKEAVVYAANKGVILVAAAGNSAYDTSYFYPAAFPETIAVSASTESDALAGFSNFGTRIDVAAPGTNIVSTWPGSSYKSANGTSMAAPHVGGLAALILAKNPSLTAAQVRQIITSTADDLGSPGKDTSFGYGRINANRALQKAAGATPGPTATPLPTTPAPTATGTIQPTATATPLPTGSPSPAGALPELADKIAQACGGKAIIAKAQSTDTAGGTHWLSYAAGYGGVEFQPTGEVFIYVQQSCSVTTTANTSSSLVLGIRVLPNKFTKGGPSLKNFQLAQTLSLQAGWNRVTLTGIQGAQTQAQQTPTAKKKSVLDRLLGR